MSNTIANGANNEIGNSNNIGKTIIPNLAPEKDRDVERGEPVRGGNPNPTPVSTSASPSASATEAHPGAPHGVVPSRRKAVARLLRRLVLGMLLVAVLAAVSALVWIYMGPIFLLQLVLVAIVAYFASGGRFRWFYVVVKTAPRDVRALSRYAKVLWAIRNYQKKNRSIADLFQLNVQRHPNKVCLIFQDQEWTFQQVDDFSNKVANVFKSHGYRKGDVVGLFLENRPEFVAIWLGLSKLGVIIPLINTNLVKSSLLHGINISKCQAVIYGTDLAEAIKDIASTLDAKIALYRFSDKPGESSNGLKEKDLTALLADAPATLPVVQEKGEYMDKLLYVFTSGTTGLPKAAVITNSRFMFIASGIHYLGAFKESDRYYTPLPLYHTAGGIMTIGQTLIHGSTTVIRKKFSASSYFNDCTKYKCTVGQYIGEMCRYILASPPKSDDKNHTVRLMFGNGLRPQIWTEFVKRFNIPKIVEFYGATEGNANIVNVDSTVGAIGFISRIIPSVYPISIIKVNDQGEPIRNAQGLCQVCEPNEPGVFIGKIIPNNPSRAFLGYVDEKASESKVVHDVFTKGDSAFISGDILMADELGYLYFKDRTGDTFRWKGENVSTSEIEGILSNLVNYRDCIVYGVEIRGAEGRAGMAAIYDPDGTLDMDKLSSDVREHLPSYARPLFVRILRTVEVTGTFKLKKKELQEEGFDVRKLEDKIYYMDPKSGYQLLTSEIFDNIQEGKLRL